MPATDGLLSTGLARLNGNLRTQPPYIIAAIGSTQAGAAAIPLGVTLLEVTTTTSAEGIRLPAQAAFLNTGATSITIVPKATVGVKLYPASGEGLNAVATNTAVVLVSAKPVNVIAIQTGYGGSAAYRWVIDKGA